MVVVEFWSRQTGSGTRGFELSNADKYAFLSCCTHECSFIVLFSFNFKKSGFRNGALPAGKKHP